MRTLAAALAILAGGLIAASAEPATDWAKLWPARSSVSDPRLRFLVAMHLHYAGQHGPEWEWRTLEDRDLTDALKQLATRLRKTDPKQEAAELYTHEADEVENAFAELRLRKIPLK